VTSYYNPTGYQTKLENFTAFYEPIARSGLACLIVECAFEDQPFALPSSLPVLRVRCRDVLWQKERLLNAALAELPRACRKVAWLDCDVLFENPEWAAQASRLLDDVPLIQPFEWAIRLPRGAKRFLGTGTVYRGFCATLEREPAAFLGGDFARHGHTGFAWAARRELLERHGLYDVCIAGSGDHLMAHGALGDWSSPCVRAAVGPDGAYARHFSEWAACFYGDVDGRTAFVPGALLHLWHGEMTHRRYADRNRELIELGLDPERDLVVGAAGAWEWKSRRPELHDWARRYFDLRLEDGTPDRQGGST
jgi:hypothetical protein